MKVSWWLRTLKLLGLWALSIQRSSHVLQRSLSPSPRKYLDPSWWWQSITKISYICSELTLLVASQGFITIHEVYIALLCNQPKPSFPLACWDSTHFTVMTILYNMVSRNVPGKTNNSHRGPQGCETSRLPHFLENPLTDGGEVVSLTRQPLFTPSGRFLVLISVRGWVDPWP
jgi:hypothetical protein